jgi:hypothetical protein
MSDLLLHWSSDTAPVVGVYLIENGQSMHWKLPLFGWYVPSSHSTHLWLLTYFDPAKHGPKMWINNSFIRKLAFFCN